MNNTYRRSHQERANNILSQNTAVAGSIKQSCINFNTKHIMAPDISKYFNRSSILMDNRCSASCYIPNRTQDCCKTGCTNDFESRCQLRVCCTRNWNQDNCCSFCNHCNTSYCRVSCHCLPNGSWNSHCCSQGNAPYRNVCNCKRDNSDSNCLHGNCLERLCNCEHINSRLHCSSSYMPPEKASCRHTVNNPHVCTSCNCRNLDTPECKSHCNKESSCHEYRNDRSALKSREPLIERSHCMYDRQEHNCLQTCLAIESAKRTKRWVQDWTPSTPSPPESSDSRACTSSRFQSRENHFSSMPPVILSSNIDNLSPVSINQVREADNLEKRKRADRSRPSSAFCGKTMGSFVPSNSQPSDSSNLQVNHCYDVNMNSKLPKATLTKNLNKKRRKLFSIIENSSVIIDKTMNDEPQTVIEESTPFCSEESALCKNVSTAPPIPSLDESEKPNINQSISNHDPDQTEPKK